MQNQIKIFSIKSPEDFKDYELLDTGEGEKLERFGPYTFVRPYESAFWSKSLEKKSWENIDGKFWSSKTGAQSTHARLASRAIAPGWKLENNIKEKWEMSYKGIKFLASPTPFRHFGFFPEQAVHWDFIEEKILTPKKVFGVTPQGLALKESKARPFPAIKFLNLFGYTGVASLFALRAGAEVTHVDASKQSLNWAKENQNLNSSLGDKPMRIIEDDVLKFLEREIKRGNKYDAVIMDPPKFGRGPKGETWKLEESLPKLLKLVQKVLSDEPLFVILTSYAVDFSALSLGYALSEIMKPARNASGIADAGGDQKGNLEVGEMCIFEKSNARFIPLANTAVWSK